MKAFNTMAEQLVPVARKNEQFMRETAAKARTRHDWRLVNQADRQARNWASTAAQQPKPRITVEFE